MNEFKCGECVRFKTQYCPCVIDCMVTDDHPYFQDRRMLLEENKQLKERLQQAEDVIGKIENYIYKNSIPINLLSNTPVNKVDFEGDINEVLDILNEYRKEV